MITADASLPEVRTLVDDGFPVAVVDPPHQGTTKCITVGATNFTGGVTATEHLLSLGHRHVAHAGGLSKVEFSEARLAGYLSALRQADIPIDESLITHCKFNYEGGRAVAPLLLDRADRPTAVFAGNDEIALGIIEEARRRSIRVPEDLSVIGFDDSFMASRSAPPLSSVAQPLIEMGQVAARSLCDLIAGSAIGTWHIELATSLVVRESTAPPPD